MNLKRSDKAALFLMLALGAFFMGVGILGAFGGALNPSGISILVQIWLRLSLIIILPLWLVMRACGVIFGSPQQHDARFIERHPAD